MTVLVFQFNLDFNKRILAKLQVLVAVHYPDVNHPSDNFGLKISGNFTGLSIGIKHNVITVKTRIDFVLLMKLIPDRWSCRSQPTFHIRDV